MLALDNERLRADLQARVEELRVSRLRIMEAGDAARRRIERNLHDGAQQQLVALALELRVLRARVRDDAAKPKIDELSERLASALAELRELARGIHPAILTDRGLAPAINSLAERATLPVDVAVELPEERLPAPVEAAAYFLVAEALTNVARYAEASSAPGATSRFDGRRAGRARRRRRRRRRRSRRPAAACAGSTIAWRRSAGRWRSTARWAAGRGWRRGCRYEVARCCSLLCSCSWPAAARPRSSASRR